MLDISSEEDFRKHVMKVALAAKHHVSHIEAHLSAAGIPDLNMFVYGQDVWLELKIVKGGIVKMRPTQRRWHREREHAGGESWVLVYDREKQHVLTVAGATAAMLAPAVAAWEAVSRAEHVANLPNILVRLGEMS